MIPVSKSSQVGFDTSGTLMASLLKRQTPIARKLAVIVFGVIALYHARKNIAEKLHFFTISPGFSLHTPDSSKSRGG